MESASEETRGK